MITLKRKHTTTTTTTNNNSIITLELVQNTQCKYICIFISTGSFFAEGAFVHSSCLDASKCSICMGELIALSFIYKLQ